MTPVLRALRNVVGAIALVVVVAAAFVAFVVRTDAGAGMVLDAAVRWSGAELAYDSVHGTLADSLELRGLRFANERVQIEAGVTELRWRPSALLGGLLHIEHVRLERAVIRLVPGDAAPIAPPPSLPALPIALRVDAFTLENTTIEAGGNAQTITLATFGGRWDRRGVGIEGLQLQVPGHAVDGSARLLRGKPLEIAANARWRGTIGGRDGEVAIALAGPLDRIQVDGTFGTVPRGTFTGRVNPFADVPRFSIRFDVEPMEIAGSEGPMQVGASRIEASGTANAVDIDLGSSLAAQDFAATDVVAAVQAVREAGAAQDWRVALDWSAKAAGRGFDGRLAGTGQARVGTEQIRFRHEMLSPYPVVLEGSVASAFDAPVLDVLVHWQALSVTVSGREPVAVESGELRVRGRPEDLAATGSFAASITPGGRVEANLEGHLSGTGFRLDRARAALLGGHVDLTGAVAWSETLSGTFAFDAVGIDLSALRADLATRIDARGDGSFRAVDSGLETRVMLSHAAGKWRGHRLSASAEVQSAPGRLVLRQVNLSLGENTARVNATIGEQLAGTFDLAFSDLGQFAPELAGRVSASGSMGGTLAAPAIDARFEAFDVGWQDWSSPSAAGTAELDLSRETQSRVTLAIDAIRRGRRAVGTLAANLDGTTGNHDVHVAFEAPGRRVTVDAHGGWRNGGWSGSLDDVRAAIEEVGEWTLEEPAAVALGPKTLTVAPVCLTAQGASACVRAEGWSATAGVAELTVAGLPLALGKDLLPRTINLGGTADLRANVERRDGLLTASGAGTIENGTVRLALAMSDGEKPPDAIAVRDARFEFEVTPEQAHVTAHADVSDWFGLETELRYGLLGEHAIDGTLAARSSNLEWVGEFLPDLAGTRGGAVVSGVFGGTLAEPRVSLEARLVDGQIRVPASGTRVSELELRMLSPAGRRLVITAHAREGEGSLNLEGELALDAAAGWPGTVRITGDRFPFVRLPDAEADASPALSAGFSTAHLDLGGTMTLPRVQIDVVALPDSAVSVSPDEIIVDRETPDANGDGEARADFFRDAVTGDVELVLGEAVAISAAGLTARMTGALRWTKARGDDLGRGAGRISVAEGSYTAYNQNLNIERGDMIFGGALDNPALDVRAIRPDLDVTAGVRVSGYMTAPVFHLYSRPAMPDSEILAYIVTGRGLDEATSGEAGVIAQAALSLSAERSSLVTSQLQHAFGLDEFSVNTGTTARETSLVAGKRLTPKLSVRSDFNPFDQLWSFFLSYKLTQTWSVEAESGHRQGADLIYSIERDELIPRRWFE